MSRGFRKISPPAKKCRTPLGVANRPPKRGGCEDLRGSLAWRRPAVWYLHAYAVVAAAPRASGCASQYLPSPGGDAVVRPCITACWLLHVPQVLAVVIARDQPVFANLERSAEPGCCNGRGGPPAFDEFRMELRQVGVM